LAQNDIKKVLAYSTVSQLGYMFLACGVGAFIAAIFHVMTHAFFKALLFLGSGSVIHGMHHEQDMRRMGNLRKYMPITFATMLTGWLAISGIPIFAGFFSKDEILYKTFAAPNIPQPWNYILWGVGLLTAVLTAVYMTRMMVMTFWGDERFHQALPDGDHPHDAAHAEENAFAAGDAHDDAMHHGHAHGEHDTHQIGHTDDQDEDEEHHALAPDFRPHESPWTMTVPLIVLAVLSTLGGLVGVPYALSGGVIPNEFEHVLEPVIAKVSHKETKHAPTGLGEHGAAGKPATANESGHSTSPMTQTDTAEHTTEAAHAEHSPEEIRTERILAGFSVLLAALGIGIGWMIFKKEPLKIMPRILQEKWRIDELYNGYIVNPITDISRNGLWRGFDVGVIDGIVNGIGHFVTALGGVARGVQVGFVRSYAAFILFGALVVIGYFIYYGFKLVG
jgi:NADH-quinone oxidoreductase subunit L